jgi:hypothetical protein
MTPIPWTPALARRAFPHPALGIPCTPAPLDTLWREARRARSALRAWPNWSPALPAEREAARSQLLKRLDSDAPSAGPPTEDLWLAWPDGVRAADLWHHLGGLDHVAACLIEAGRLYDELGLHWAGTSYRRQLPAARALLSAASPAARAALYDRFCATLDEGLGAASILPFLLPDHPGLAEALLARPDTPVHHVPYLLLSLTDGELLRQGLNDSWGSPLVAMLPDSDARPEEAWETILLGFLATAGHAAAPALLSRVGPSRYARGLPAALVQALALLDTDEALAGVVGLIELARRPAAAALQAAGARGLRALATGPSSPATRTLLDTMLLKQPALEDEALAVGGWPADHVQQRRRHAGAPRAATEALPPVLRRPPWLHGPPAARPLVPGLAAPPWEESVRWRRGEREELLDKAVDWPEKRTFNLRTISRLASALGVPAHQMSALSEDPSELVELLRPHARACTRLPPWVLVRVPEAVACMVWSTAPPGSFSPAEEVGAFVATLGTPALDGLLRWAETSIVRGAAYLRPFDSPRAAPLIARALAEHRAARAAAKDWLRSHPAAAAAGLVPRALDTAPVPGEQAAAALRLLARWGHREVILAAATAHGEAARSATQALLDVDPLQLFPAAIPKLPAFLAPDALPPPVLKAGGALPTDAVAAALSMLQWSSPDDPYAGVAELRTACEPASLDAFAWALYEAWLGAGAPSKESWAFRALGLLGGDAIAARLEPLIRRWPLESLHARAVLGLDVLVQIGTDGALQRLDAIATKTRTRALQAEARERIEQIAQDRGLTRDELSDRVTPDLGLGPDGALTLDFGPRQFTLRLDAALKPVVCDAEGRPLKDLPKPGAKDDPALSAAAVETHKAFKKAAREIGAHVLARMERALITGSRWSADDVRTLLAPHPVLGHVARRLVWVVEGRPARLDEAGGFVDADDRPVQPHGPVHLAHPADTEGLDVIGRALAEYRLPQPFPQVGRAVHRLTPEEASSDTLTSFANLTVPTPRVLGLTRYGWRRGRPVDAGIIEELHVEIGEHTVTLSLDPGFMTDEPGIHPEQTIVRVSLRHADRPATFGELGVRQVSELILGLVTLR